MESGAYKICDIWATWEGNQKEWLLTHSFLFRWLRHCKQTDDYQLNIPPRNSQWWWWERENCTCRDALGLWGTRANAKGFSKAAMSSSVQQGQLPCARPDSFLDQKSSSSSTTPWRRGRSTRRSLLLHVCVHLPIPLYPSTTFAVHRSFPEHTRYKQRWHREITAIVSIVCC
jgi:hypothetical protein